MQISPHVTYTVTPMLSVAYRANRMVTKVVCRNPTFAQVTNVMSVTYISPHSRYFRNRYHVSLVHSVIISAMPSIVKDLPMFPAYDAGSSNTPMLSVSAFRFWIVWRREYQRETVVQIARSLHCSRRMVYYWWLGKFRPSRQVRALAALLAHGSHELEEGLPQRPPRSPKRTPSP